MTDLRLSGKPVDPFPFHFFHRSSQNWPRFLYLYLLDMVHTSISGN